jgi:hypothetical protein
MAAVSVTVSVWFVVLDDRQLGMKGGGRREEGGGRKPNCPFPAFPVPSLLFLPQINTISPPLTSIPLYLTFRFMKFVIFAAVTDCQEKEDKVVYGMKV